VRWILSALLGAMTALLQLGLVPLLFPGAAAPVLPVALVAAWLARGDAAELAPGLLVMAVALGVASEERVGWLLVAMLPAGALLLAIELRDGLPRPLRAALAAWGGALLYGALVSAAAGSSPLPAHGAGALAGAALWTALAAIALATALRPLQPRAPRLFE
jgi:hypothetical protein